MFWVLPCFHHVVAVLRVSLHGYFSTAPRASEIKAEDGDAQVVLPDDVLLARVELGPFDDVVAAGIAHHGHGEHHAHLRRVRVRVKG